MIDPKIDVILGLRKSISKEVDSQKSSTQKNLKRDFAKKKKVGHTELCEDIGMGSYEPTPPVIRDMGYDLSF